MSFSRRRVVGGASKECGGAEHVLSKVSYWQFAFWIILIYLKKELCCTSKK